MELIWKGLLIMLNTVRVSEKTKGQVIDFLANCHVGSSSKSLALAALGANQKRISYPYDPDDLSRCLNLLDHAPGARVALGILAKKNAVWDAYREHWHEMESLFEKGHYSKLHELMQKLRKQSGE